MDRKKGDGRGECLAQPFLLLLLAATAPVVLGKVSGLLSIIREPLSNLQLLVGTMEIM